MYKYLESLGWKNEGRVGVEKQFHDFTITANWGMPFKLRIDLSYAAEGTWVDIFYFPKQHLKGNGERIEKLRFSGVVFSNKEIPLLMKQMQITIEGDNAACLV
jgi:hypothetical protein